MLPDSAIAASALRESEHDWEAPGAGRAPPGMSHTSGGQLVWLTLLIGVAIGPHTGSIHPWITAGLAASVIWRLGAAYRGWQLPGKIVRAALTILGSVAVVFTYRRISGLDSGSALLIVMLALKLLETHSTRDRSIVILISWFVLFASFLREQSVASIPLLAAGVLVGTLALLQSARPSGPLTLRRALQMTGRLLLHALPLALALFLLFPRLPGPFWALPSSGGNGRTGLSDQMNPGDITALAQSDEVAFRVRFTGPAPMPAELYWRGPVLERFDGRAWRTVPDSVRDRRPTLRNYTPPPGPGRRVFSYEITLEPNQQRWLLPLESPLAWDVPDSRLSGTLELLRNRPLDRRMAWSGRSVASGSFRDPKTPDRLDLELAGGNPRSRALARDMRAAAASNEDYLQSILQMFRQQKYFYTLKPPALGEQPVDDFLFGTRAGFCEHYASAFAVLARAAGLPARVVAGYQGGARNPLADYWIVRQSDAHAWTEVWLDGRWVRYDPTAAVAPERIENGIEAALPGLASEALPMLGSGEWLERLALRWDAVNATWDRWVLAFGPDQQSALLEGLGIRSPSLRDVAIACAATVSVILLLFTWLGLRTHAVQADPVEASWQRLCRLLGKKIRPRAPAETPAEYAAAVTAARPDLGTAIQDLAALYLHLRYDGVPTFTETRHFASLVRELRVPPAPAPG